MDIILSDNLKGKDHSEGLGVDGRISEGLRKIEWKSVCWIRLAQDTDQWRVLPKTVMNIQVP
jgi:hypothetical protein